MIHAVALRCHSKWCSLIKIHPLRDFQCAMPDTIKKSEKITNARAVVCCALYHFTFNFSTIFSYSFWLIKWIWWTMFIAMKFTIVCLVCRWVWIERVCECLWLIWECERKKHPNWKIRSNFSTFILCFVCVMFWTRDRKYLGTRSNNFSSALQFYAIWRNFTNKRRKMIISSKWIERKIIINVAFCFYSLEFKFSVCSSLVASFCSPLLELTEPVTVLVLNHAESMAFFFRMKFKWARTDFWIRTDSKISTQSTD